MEACLYPRQVARRLIRDPWLVLRVLLCIGVFVAFAFWDRSNLDQTEVSESAVKGDKLVAAMDWLHEIFVANPTRVPVVSAHILVFVYLFVLVQFAIYIQTGDFIFPAVLIAWLLALLITWLSPQPISATAIRYNQGAWFVLERFVTDTTVSWHLMMLILAIDSVRRVYPYYPTYLLSVLVFVLTGMYLLATRNTYTSSIGWAALCAGAGIAGQHFLRTEYERRMKLRRYEQMPDDDDREPMTRREIELAKDLANEFAPDHRVAEKPSYRTNDGEIDLDELDTQTMTEEEEEKDDTVAEEETRVAEHLP